MLFPSHDLYGDGKVTMKDILMGRGVIKRPKKKGGGLMEATSRLRAQGLKKGGRFKRDPKTRARKPMMGGGMTMMPRAMHTDRDWETSLYTVSLGPLALDLLLSFPSFAITLIGIILVLLLNISF